MIIAVDGSEAFVKNRTGVENYCFYILQNLAKIDQKNSYLIYLDRRTNSVTGDWPDNFKFKYLKWSVLWTQIGLALQTYLDKMDLLFIPGHTLPILKNPTVKSVVTVHDLGAEYLGSLHQWKQRLYLGLMEKVQIRFATKIIAVSESTKKDLVQKIGIKPHKVEVVYEARVPLETKNDTNVDILSKIDLKKGKYFLFVGTIQPRKNISRIIEAFYELENPELKLVLAGGKGWLSDEIYQLPKKLGIEERVIFTRRVSDQDIQDLYVNALAFVFPSLFEGFGLPILEAFHYGLPVITSSTSSMPEVAGKAAILVDPYSVEEIKKAIQLLTIDNNFRQKLIKLGKEQEKKFNWEKSAKETLKLFEEAYEG
jgi:glycosyltransferase involved in cell wall biosynthesis